MEALILLENVSKFYTSATNVVVGLNNIQLSFGRGEFVAITGESGSGKSTLSHVLGGMLGYESGEMRFAGQPTSHYDSSDWERYRRDNISFISQNYGILPGATVLANVLGALRLAGLDKQESELQARQILEQVELWDLRHRRAARLSSGQKQRLSIARALAKPAPVLIADEPTGNLDPENSAKVIELLRQAAQNRLVLLVTHEFDEVRDYATRHIRLQDGRVVMDAQLRPAHPAQEVQKRQRPTRQMGGYVARLQLKSRPVWMGLMTLFFTLTAFAVFAFLGAFIIALDDTDTRIYDSTAFLNGSPNRIVVSALDFQPLEAADYEKLASLPYVQAVERNGYVTDVQYSYRDGVDYTTKRTEKVTGSWDNPIHTIEVTYHPHSNAPYMQTVPVLPAGQTFLQNGRLPEHFYEVVAHSRDGLEIGQQVKVFLTNRRYWGISVFLPLEFTVVGITDYGQGLYFHDDMGRFCQQVAHTTQGSDYYQFLPAPAPDYHKYDHLPSLPEGFTYELQDGQACIHNSIMISKKWELDERQVLQLKVPNVNLKQEGLDPTAWENLVTRSTPPLFHYTYPDPNAPEAEDAYLQEVVYSYAPHTTAMFTRLIYVNQNTFDQLCWDQPSEQVSLTITDYAYTDRVLKALEAAGYVGASPFQLGSTRVNEEKAAQREQTLTVCLLALVAVVALQIVMLRAMFGMQTESYQLLRNIGLSSKGAKRSVFWQFALFTVLGQLLGGGGVYLCGHLGLRRIADVLKYLPPAYMAILSAVHMAAALLAALWVQRVLVKQVYPTAGRFADLQMDEEVEA